MPPRLLVVITSEVADDKLGELVRSRVGDAAEMLVVAPASDLSRLEWLTNAEGDARSQAGSLAVKSRPGRSPEGTAPSSASRQSASTIDRRASKAYARGSMPVSDVLTSQRDQHPGQTRQRKRDEAARKNDDEDCTQTACGDRKQSHIAQRHPAVMHAQHKDLQLLRAIAAPEQHDQRKQPTGKDVTPAI